MPNCLKAGSWPVVVVLSLISLVQLTLASTHHNDQQQEPPATNEILTSTKAKLSSYQVGPAVSNFSQFSREVTNLRLGSDLRSIKLRWTYEHNNANQPESFRIRYCELTSWMAEIKCRHREMPVRVQLKQATTAANDDAGNDSNSTVITKTIAADSQQANTSKSPLASVRPAVMQVFETQIYDLRALTNYTFQVRVSRFIGEQQQQQRISENALGEQILDPNARSTTRQRPGRRLDLTHHSTDSVSEPQTTRIETTKPFSAEALRCLANSSEVLVNTGRYFGGRISVEGQLDQRCQLLGNKSSEQTVYTFHIDHEACRSKVLDGNRIETMILVHENRDILTHNTARFLVQCNIGQQSFTVKASISLPRVMNSLGGNSPAMTRQAVITPLASRPLTRDVESGDRVHLGSMPGVYRLIRADNTATVSSPMSNYLAGETTAAATSVIATTAATISNELGNAKQSIVAAESQAARSLPLLASTAALDTAGKMRNQRQSKELAPSELLVQAPPGLPKPVDVSSKLLFVEPASEAAAASGLALESPLQRRARLMLHGVSAASFGQSTPPMTTGANLLRKRQSTNHSNHDNRMQSARTADFSLKPLASTKLTPAANAGRRQQKPPDNEDEVDERQLDGRDDYDEGNSSAAAAAVIMTNNHRVAGNFASLAQTNQAPANLRAPKVDLSEQTIKYSANQVDEYSLNKLAPHEAVDWLERHLQLQQAQAQSHNQMARSRSGRMRKISASSTSSTTSTTTGKPFDANPTKSPTELPAGLEHVKLLESRMGDVMQPAASEIQRSRHAASHNSSSHEISGKQLQTDLLATTTTTNHQANQSVSATIDMQQQQQQTTTMAHNITGALIRWSLKTLGQLARKSLESLVLDEQVDQGEAKGALDEPRELASTQSVLWPSSTISSLPPLQSFTLATPTEKTISRISGNSLMNPTDSVRWQANEGGQASDPVAQLDGFVIGSRAPTVRQQHTTKLPAQTTRRPNGGVSQVVARSGDQAPKSPSHEIEQLRQARQQRLESASAASSPPTQTPLALSSPSPAPAEARRTSTMANTLTKRYNSDETSASERHLSTKTTSVVGLRSIWPLYGLWALCGLIALIVIAIYFVLMSPRRDRSGRASYDRRAKLPPTQSLLSRFNNVLRPTGNSAPPLPQRTCHNVNGQANFAPPVHSKPILCYSSRPASSDSFSPQKAMVGSSSYGSATTRSTSAASSCDSSRQSSSNSPINSHGRGNDTRCVESYCKNQEQCVVYTDHLILTDDNSSLGDDDSRWLTRSGRRRPPSESFA